MSRAHGQPKILDLNYRTKFLVCKSEGHRECPLLWEVGRGEWCVLKGWHRATERPGPSQHAASFTEEDQRAGRCTSLSVRVWECGSDQAPLGPAGQVSDGSRAGPPRPRPLHPLSFPHSPFPTTTSRFNLYGIFPSSMKRN